MTPSELARASRDELHAAVARLADAQEQYEEAKQYRLDALRRIEHTEVECPTCGTEPGVWCNGPHGNDDRPWIDAESCESRRRAARKARLDVQR